MQPAQCMVKKRLAALAEVILSRTSNINSGNQSKNLIQNALVILETSKGESEILDEIAPGHYRSKELKGKPGAKYSLTVQTNENKTIINSEDVMPNPVSICRLRARKSILPEVEGIDMPEWEVVVEYCDPANEINYYRLVEYINGKQIASYVANDQLNNGKENKCFLTNFDRKLKSGDTLTIEMQSISKAVYNYFYSFSCLNQLIQGSIKSNPTNNLNGAELGYFSAYAPHSKSIIIP